MVPLKKNFCYAILDVQGMAANGHGASGMFLHDTRHLSIYNWAFDGLTLVHQRAGNDYIEQFFSRMDDHAQSILLHRKFRLNPDGFLDEINIENWTHIEKVVGLGLSVDADFADIFEARGGRRKVPKNPVAVANGGTALAFSYEAQDALVSSSIVEWVGVDPRGGVVVPARGKLALNIKATFLREDDAGYVDVQDQANWAPLIEDGHLSILERSLLRQATDDIGALILATPQGRTIAAGIPNFVVPFGRDSLITAWLLLDVDPSLSRSVLVHLASLQARSRDPFREAEPGKIMHEQRRSELSRIGQLPFSTYYGSADSTPLFVFLLGEYVERTGDRALALQLEDAWRLAISWIESYRDERGLINFNTLQVDSGLTVQSWKDSDDSMSYRDGALGRGPLAVAEVQGYVFASYKAAAELSLLCDGPEQERSTWQNAAHRLSVRFDDLYWMPHENTYAIAIDANNRQLDVVASDTGHLLWSGIVSEGKVARVVERLFADDMWTGFGLRTLSEREVRYNPLSYHNGSVWPHDTALFAAGLRRYGRLADFSRVRAGLVDLAASSHDLRLPELVGGYPKQGNIPPLPYVESCRPQAWAAAAMIYVLTAG